MMWGNRLAEFDFVDSLYQSSARLMSSNLQILKEQVPIEATLPYSWQPCTILSTCSIKRAYTAPAL